MIDNLVRELQKEITESKVEEEEAQADYEKFMSDSKEKRKVDSESIAEKEAAKAETAAKQHTHGEELKGTMMELMDNAKYTSELHGECDWLIKNYDVRKSARADEGDALTKAK